MKFKNTIIILLVILFLTLLVGTLIGFRLQEGITYNELTILQNILPNTGMNEESRMAAIKSMEIKDNSFKNVIGNTSVSDVDKIKTLNGYVNSLLPTNLEGKTYKDAWSTELNLPT